MKKKICKSVQLKVNSTLTDAIIEGGQQMSKRWFKYKFTQSNDAAMIAMVAVDFQNKN
jgi:hypothetical protein